jgi:hypothetical protein
MYRLTLFYTSGPMAGFHGKLRTPFSTPVGARGHCPNGGRYVVTSRHQIH